MEFCCRWSALVVAIAAVAAAAAGIDGVIDGNGYWLPFIFFFSVSFLCFGISALSLYSNARYETIGITFSIVVSVIEMTDAHWTKKNYMMVSNVRWRYTHHAVCALLHSQLLSLSDPHLPLYQQLAVRQVGIACNPSAIIFGLISHAT